MRFTLDVNGRKEQVDVDPDTPLLWVLRDELGLNGTKFGCGIAQCGACTVHLDDETARSCVIPISAVGESRVRTIEGLEGDEAVAIEDAWIAAQVPQCGYCQSGQVMSAVALLREIPKPSDEDVDRALAGNICRCATYLRIRGAVHEAADALGSEAEREEAS